MIFNLPEVFAYSLAAADGKYAVKTEVETVNQLQYEKSPYLLRPRRLTVAELEA
jgi:hypothetical protein